MLRPRIIPILLLREGSLVKTIRFNKFSYVGDPCNTALIFNELEVDELIFLDIQAYKKNIGPDINLLNDLSNECFMPLSYGGGIRNLDDAKAIFDVGFEKISINTNAIVNPNLITEIAKEFGSQSLIVSIDVKKNIWSGKRVRINGGKTNTSLDPCKWAKKIVELGAGEILLTSIDNEGTWKGFDIPLIKEVASSVSIPIIAHGGAGKIDDIHEAIYNGNASAVALGSMVVFQKKNMGILINFPDKIEIENIFNNL